MSNKFTFPFRYTPNPGVVRATAMLRRRIAADASLNALCSKGKMLGVLVVSAGCGGPSREQAEALEKVGALDLGDGTYALCAFGGSLDGRMIVDGFVPPIFDWTMPGGRFKTVEAQITELNRTLDNTSEDADKELIALIKSRRRDLSEDLQKYLFESYIALNARGQKKSILEIFSDRGLTPPSGTGDCAAPKLLQYAYQHNLEPLAMGESWYGESPRSGEVRRDGSFYPSCLGKCGPLLGFMLQGLDVEENPLEKQFEGSETVIYADDWIIVADKPSGMLSVPGKSAVKSLLERLQDKYGELYSCHRLDMDTSGLIVFARGKDIKTVMEAKFARHEVSKRYLARLSAPKTVKIAHTVPSEGEIRLPLSLDYYDRPRQMVDFDHGKTAVTRYRFLDDGDTVELEPLTGRTHQLRVHCSSDLGLGRPILGDLLYGGDSSDRLHLYASYLKFSHPYNVIGLRVA